MKTIQQLAQEYLEHFKTSEGEGGFSTYTWDDQAPEELKDLVREAHGDMLPEDYRFNYIVESLEKIAEDYDEESIEADIYDSDLSGWFASHSHRIGYCDQFVEDFGLPEAKNFKIINIVAGGQYMEKTEVYRSVLNSLEKIIEEMDDELDEEDLDDEDTEDLD